MIEGRHDLWLIPMDVRPLLFLEAFVSVIIQEQTLRALVAAGSVSDLIARRSQAGWVLMVRVGSAEAPLQLQRGGTRQFKSLDAVANVVESIGQTELIVKLHS